MGSGNGSVTVRPVRTRSERGLFARLPRLLYAQEPGFTPPLDLLEAEAFDPAKNPLFTHAAGEFWLAFRGSEPVGRISALVDSLEPVAGVGHFGSLAARNDQEAVAALFEAAEGWLAARSIGRATGPFTLSVNQQSGLMVAGQAEPAMFLTPWDPPYLGPLVEACGYAKARDLLTYDFTVTGEPIHLARALEERHRGKGRVSVRAADFKSLDSEVKLVVGLFNDAWRDNWGYAPLTEQELSRSAKEMKLLITPQSIVIVELDGEPVAFAIRLPNVAEAAADLGGRLLPFGWAKLAWRLLIAKSVKSARVPLMGLKSAYRNTLYGGMLTLLTIDALRRDGHREGYERADLGWVLDDNRQMRRLAEQIGARHSKTHRVYEKAIRE